MPSVSKSQQRLMGVAYAVKSGSMELKDVDSEYRDKVASLLGDVDTNVINEIYLYLESKSRKQLVALIDKLDEGTDFLLIIDQLKPHQ